MRGKPSRRRPNARGGGSRRPVLFRHLMVPVDLSDRHDRALRMAQALAADRRTRVTLLHVVQRVQEITVGELEGFYRRLVETSERRLRQLARPLAERGIDVRTEVRIGEPAAEIVRAALRERVDALVMGSHKVRPGSRAHGWGTTSYKVGIFSQCPHHRTRKVRPVS